MKIASFLVILCAFLVSLSAAPRYYVKKQGNDSNDGKTWSDAFASLVKAIEKAQNDISEDPSVVQTQNIEIWIASGTYAAGSSMKIGGGISLMGGFSGDENSPTQRVVGNETVLSGENKYLVIDNNFSSDAPMSGILRLDRISVKNSIMPLSVISTSGLIIQLVGINYAIIFRYSNIEIKDCRIENNQAGIYAENSKLSIADSFIGNNLDNGIYCYEGAEIFLSGCVITGNKMWGISGSNYGKVNMLHSTLCKNAYGVSNVSFFAVNSIVLGAENFSGILSPIANNCITNSYVNGENNIIATDALLMPLYDYGGLIPILPPLENSPVRAAGMSAEKLAALGFEPSEKDSSGTIRDAENPSIGATEWKANLLFPQIVLVSPATVFTDEKVEMLVYCSSSSTTFEWIKNGTKIPNSNSYSFAEFPDSGRTSYSVKVNGTSLDNGINTTAVPRIIKVSSNGDDANPGESWENPKKSIAAAVEISASASRYGNTGQVWVAKGKYSPSEAIYIKDYVKIYGGFSGTEKTPSERFGGDSSEISSDGTHSVFIASETVGALLDGFIVKSGLYGVYIESSDIVVSSCLFTQNSTGGIYLEMSNSTIENCTLVSNGGDGITAYGLKKTISFNPDTQEIINSDSYALNLMGTILNCTISQNDGYGVRGDIKLCKNSILWNNAAGEIGDITLADKPLRGYTYQGSSGSLVINGTSISDVPLYSVKPKFNNCIVRGGIENGEQITDENPLLSELAYNGGCVPTMAVGDESPAKGKGSLKSPHAITDSRGVYRKIPSTLGAYEYTGGEEYEKWAFSSGLKKDAFHPEKCNFDDGVSNLARFAFGLPVNRAVSMSDFPNFSFSIKSSELRGATEKSAQYASLSYGVKKNAENAGVKVKVMSSENLVDWNEISSNCNGSDTDSTKYISTCEVPQTGKIFLRLDVAK